MLLQVYIVFRLVLGIKEKTQVVCFVELLIIYFNFTLFSNNIDPILNFQLSEINYLFLFILIGIMCLLLLIALLIVVALLRFVAIFMLYLHLT